MAPRYICVRAQTFSSVHPCLPGLLSVEPADGSIIPHPLMMHLDPEPIEHLPHKVRPAPLHAHHEQWMVPFQEEKEPGTTFGQSPWTRRQRRTRKLQ
jgi:hypothetical protein